MVAGMSAFAASISWIVVELIVAGSIASLKVMLMLTDRLIAVAPPAGEVVVTSGGVVSETFDTVTPTAAEVVWLPAASRARALRECAPAATEVEFQATTYGAAVTSDPRLAPSRRNCTPTTATLSLAVALTLTVPETVAPFAGDEMLTVGAVRSTGGGTASFTVTVTAA